MHARRTILCFNKSAQSTAAHFKEEDPHPIEPAEGHQANVSQETGPCLDLANDGGCSPFKSAPQRARKTNRAQRTRRSKATVNTPQKDVLISPSDCS